LREVPEALGARTHVPRCLAFDLGRHGHDLQPLHADVRARARRRRELHSPRTKMIHAVLFDLDGTFADTAPDLARAVNAMRAARGLPPVSVEATRPVTSTGARGLLRVGFDM